MTDHTTRALGMSDVGWRQLLQSFTPADFDDAHVVATLECVARLAVTPTSEPFQRWRYRPDNPFTDQQAPEPALAPQRDVVIDHVSGDDRMAAIGFLASFVTPPAQGDDDLAVTCARELWHYYDLYRVLFAIVVGSQGDDPFLTEARRQVQGGETSPSPAPVPAHRERLVALGILNSLLTVHRLGGPASQLPGVDGPDGPDGPDLPGPPSPN